VAVWEFGKVRRLRKKGLLKKEGNQGKKCENRLNVMYCFHSNNA